MSYGMSDGGKGSKPRPYSVSQEEFDNRWENIFGKKKKPEQKTFDQRMWDQSLENMKENGNEIMGD